MVKKVWSSVRRRWRAVSEAAWGLPLALLALLVPTVFTVLPELASGPGLTLSYRSRVLVIVAWSLTALVVTVANLRHQRGVTDLVGKERERLAEARANALDITLRALVSHPPHLPATYAAALYLPNEAGDLLQPFFPETITDPDDPRVFPPGCGAVGQAWEQRSVVIALDDAVSDDTHRLSPGQQEHFAKDRAVGAFPTRKQDGQVIAVLAVISPVNDGQLGQIGADGDYEEGPALPALQELADQLVDPLEALLAL